MGLLKRWAPLLMVLGLAVAFYVAGLHRYLSLETLRERHAELSAFVAAHFWISLLIYVAAYAALTTSAIPGAVFVTLTGGFLFGTWVGGAATALGATLGAIAVYYVVRTALGAALRERAERAGGTLRRVQEGLHRNAFSYLLTLRLIPAVPFVLINVASGLASVPLRAYAAATFLGILPATFIYSAIGAGLGALFARGERPNLKIILEPQFLLPLLGLAFLSFALPLIVRAVRGKAATP
ncbi:MAG TPA: TVP38/TMEM64 family protein [Caulobacteraceae bacterium]|nr:TVP38/TMEM64 family protein [Caulobacteraceae bacterium]